MTLVALIAVLAVTHGALRSAEANSKPEKRPARERAAKKACITGDVRKGIDLLEHRTV
jgi:hypothetical protein